MQDPFASSFAIFAAGRAFEQIRNSAGTIPHLTLEICATHAGIFPAGEDGATHQCCDADHSWNGGHQPGRFRNAQRQLKLLQSTGPVYRRLGRLAVEDVNDPQDYHFEIGKGVVLRDGKRFKRSLPQV